MVMTVMSVATPMVRPSMVSEVLSLCARKEPTQSSRLSRMGSMVPRRAFPLLYQIPSSFIWTYTVPAWRDCPPLLFSYGPEARGVTKANLEVAEYRAEKEKRPGFH